MRKEAVFSEDGKYRYRLTRLWDESQPMAMCIGLNPSTANATDDDPTITRLCKIMCNHNYGGFYMLNLFGMISPYPSDLQASTNPVGDNDFWLNIVSESVKDVVFCWGNFSIAWYRAQKIIKQFPEALCFGFNSNGSPKHPLYLKATCKLQPYSRRKYSIN